MSGETSSGTPEGRGRDARPRERRGGPPRWIAMLGQGVAALLGLAMLAAAGGLLLLTQTAAGRGAVADLVEGALEGTVRGEVEVGPVVGGNLFTRAHLRRFRISGPEGEVFVELHGVRVEYGPLGMLTGRYHLRRVRADRAVVHLAQDSAGTWNFQRIFGDPAPDREEGGGGTELIATDVRIADGEVVVSTPWEGAPGEGGEPVWRIEEGPGGPRRVVSLEGMRGRLPYLRLVHPSRPLRLELQEVAGRLAAVRQPLELEEFTGSATLGDTVDVAIASLRTPASRLTGEGFVVPEDPPRLRFDLQAGRLAFVELAWLPVPVPERGGGSGGLVLRTADDPATLVVEVEDGDFRTGGSRLTGGFALFLEDPPRFEGLDLRLRPLRLALVHGLTGREGRTDGTVEGRISGSGPVSLFRIDADVELEPREGDGGASGLQARGGVDLTGGGEFRDLRLELRDFDPRWTRLVDIDTRQAGRVDGTATLDRAPGGRVAFTADLRHRLPGDTTSSVRGRGSFAADTAGGLDVELEVRPLTLSVLDPYFPALDMVGVVRGTVALRGTLADLSARADLVTPRGELSFQGQFDLAARRRRYDARLTARGIQLQQWFEGGPSTRLDVSGRVAGEGTDPDALDATFDLEVLPSRVEGARIDSSLLRFRVEEGLARVDTLAIRSDVGTVRGRGGIGLAADHGGALYLDMEVPDLRAWNRWLVPGRAGGRPDTTARDLFALFPEAEGEEDDRPAEAAPPDTLQGQLSARGVLYGSLGALGVGGSLRASRVSYGPASADSVQAVLDVPAVRALDSLTLRGRGWGLALGERRVDSTSVRLARAGRDSLDVELDAHSPSGALAVRAAVEWREARKAARIGALEVAAGGQRLRLQQPASVAYGDSGLVVRGFALRGEGGALLRAEGEIPRAGEARFDFAAEGIGLDGVRRLAGREQEVSGWLSGELTVRGRASSPRMDARLRVDSVGVGGLTYQRLEATASYADRQVEGRASLRGAGVELAALSGTVRADLSFSPGAERGLLEDPLDLRLRGDSVPLALLLAPVDGVREVRGHAAADLRITGSPGEPVLEGSGEVFRGEGWITPLAVRFRDVRGVLGFRGTEVAVDSLSLASSRGGTGVARGSVGLGDPDVPSFDLELEARQLRAIERRRMSFVVDGRGTLGGSFRRPTLSGSFRLSNGTIRMEEFLRRDEIVDLTDPELLALVDTTALEERRLLDRARNPFMQNLRADVALQVGPDLWLRSEELNVELAGEMDLRMDRAQGDVTLFGDVRLVRGTYRWSPGRGVISRQLRITDGSIEFVGTPGVDPNLDITAAHRVRTGEGPIVVNANITGTLLSPQLALSSEPPLSESDQVCVLLTNSPCAGAFSPQLAAGQLLGRVGTEITSLLAGGGGPDYVTLQGAEGQGARRNGEGDQANDESLLAGRELEVGWYLSPELFLTFTQPLGGRMPSGSLEWRFSEAWTLEFLSENRFGQRFGATASNLENVQLWGLFLFRDWSF